MRDDETERAEDYTGPLDLPDHHDPVDEVGDSNSPTRSVIDDALALFADGKTYAEAELRYQKSRAGYVSNRLEGCHRLCDGRLRGAALGADRTHRRRRASLVPPSARGAQRQSPTLVLLAAGVFVWLLKGRLDDIRELSTAETANDRSPPAHARRQAPARFRPRAGRGRCRAHQGRRLLNKGMAKRALFRLRENAGELYDEALDVADSNKGAVAAVFAALVVVRAQSPSRHGRAGYRAGR